MKYLSLDIETTGLDPDSDQLLQVSMIVENTERPSVEVEALPHFTCFIKHERVVGNAYALGMNGWILDIISGRNPKSQHSVLKGKNRYELEENGYFDTWILSAMKFLDTHFGKDRITVAGKNVAGFDIPFLPKVIRKRFRHRCIDAGTLFIDWSKDRMPPDLAECKERAGIDTPVAHDAREDAMDVIRLIRARTKKEMALGKKKRRTA